MRRLTIKRTKSFVGCLATAKVYIECEDGDTKIKDASCKKLGEIKNGEEASFEIGEESTRVFVIADKLSADYCNDFYTLDAGDKDIYLTGKNRLNPARANAFLFDGNNSPEVETERKKSVKKGGLVLVCSVLIGLVFGFGVSTAIFEIIGAQPETYSAGEMSITLTKAFNQQYVYGYDGVFISENVEVMVFKNGFDKMDTKELSVTEYAKAVLSRQEVLDYDTHTEDGNTSYVYTREASDGTSYQYHLYAFKSEDAYWHVFFAVKENMTFIYEDDVPKWASSIVFE